MTSTLCIAALVLLVLLAALAPCAQADTIYKCVGADGKVGFSSRPCEGSAKEARRLAVPAPEPDDVSAERLKREREQLRLADKHFKRRQAERNAEYAWQGPRFAIAGGKSRAQKAKVDKETSERETAARQNAARMGNCTTRRPEAGCL